MNWWIRCFTDTSHKKSWRMKASASYLLVESEMKNRNMPNNNNNNKYPSFTSLLENTTVLFSLCLSSS